MSAKGRQGGGGGGHKFVYKAKGDAPVVRVRYGLPSISTQHCFIQLPIRIYALLYEIMDTFIWYSASNIMFRARKHFSLFPRCLKVFWPCIRWAHRGGSLISPTYLLLLLKLISLLFGTFPFVSRRWRNFFAPARLGDLEFLLEDTICAILFNMFSFYWDPHLLATF
jgi:hypothetical protein